jgi:protein SCO1
MKPAPSLPIISVMLAALAAIAVASWVAWSWIGRGDSSGRSGPGGTAQAQMDIGGPFTLTDHHGKTVTDKTYRGQYLLVYFGYGFCPDVCPTELANIATAMDDLGDKANKVTPLFITVDPERDTPQFLADYVANFHPRMVGLTGTPEQIKTVAKEYKVYYAKSKRPGQKDYLMDHTSFVYLMGPDGRFLTLFRGQTDPKAIAQAISNFMAKPGTVTQQSPKAVPQSAELHR